MVWWEQARDALAAQQWPVLEGCLWRLLELSPHQAEWLDLLGHALLMQGHYVRCQEVLEQALAHGSTSFWTPHKLGDVHRGQQRPALAIPAYEQALQWGSTSSITVRNLLEVLHAEGAALALARLYRWAAESPPPWAWQAPPFWLQGAIDAATRVHGTALADWLSERGCPDPSVRAVAWQETLYRLELPATLALLAGSPHPRDRALGERIRGLAELA